MNEAFLNLILDEIRRGRLTCFIGADLPSSVTGLPNGYDLAQELATYYNLSPRDKRPAFCALAQQVGRARRRDVVQFLMERLETLNRTPQPFDLLLARLPINLFITTRYDDLLERAFQMAQRPLQAIVTDLDASLHRADRATLIKLYGDLRQPHTLTLTEDDLYDLVAQKRGVLDLVQQAFSNGTVLFLGYDLYNPDFLTLWREVLRRLKEYAPLAYATMSETMTAADRQLWRDRNIEVLDESPLAIVQALVSRLSSHWPEMPAAQMTTAEETSVRVPAFALTGTHPSGPSTILEQITREATPPVAAYRNFDLELSREGDSILARVLRSPEGEDTALMAASDIWPPSLDGLETLSGVDEQIGRCLLPGAVGERWAASLATAEAAGEGLRLRLFLREASLAGIAWEAAKIRDRWLALRPQTPIVRYVSAARPPGTVEVNGPLHLLVLLSALSTEESSPLDLAAERTALEEALHSLQVLGKVQIDWLEGSLTRSDLLDALRRLQPHLLHFVGHGFYDETTCQGGLILERPGANKQVPDPVGTAELGVMLDGSHVRLALLNACQTGRAVGGVAEALVKRVLPAAVGMQADVPNEAAVAFASAFYRAIADGWPIDAATVEGRRFLAAQVGLDSPWWALPVLYMRSEEGWLFK
jgi:hypothetical protein